jgi:hypothetical protein
MGGDRSRPLRAQDPEFLVAYRGGRRRLDPIDPSRRLSNGAPTEKGVNGRRIALDVDRDSAVAFVADPTREATTASLTRCRRAEIDALDRAGDSDDRPPRFLVCHGSVLATL